jgi:hypothetical protein
MPVSCHAENVGDFASAGGLDASCRDTGDAGTSLRSGGAADGLPPPQKHPRFQRDTTLSARMRQPDVVLIHPPSVFDFRERDIFYGPNAQRPDVTDGRWSKSRRKPNLNHAMRW